MENRLVLLRNRFIGDDMLRHGSIMVIAYVLMGGLNYLYQFLMGIMLPGDEFGTLYPLIAVLTLITVFTQAIQISIVKFTSKFKAQDMLGSVNYLWRFSIKRSLVAGMILFLGLCLLSPLISDFIHEDNYAYLFILFASLILSFALPVNYGILQGMQRFFPLGLSGILSSLTKLTFAVCLVFLGFGLYGAIIPQLLSAIVVFGITSYLLRDLAKTKNEQTELSGLYQFAGPTLLASTAFLVLISSDALLVKHYFDNDIAGSYSAISILGKIALYLPAGIAVAMLPKTSELFETGASHRLLVLKATLITAFLSGLVVVAYAISPDFFTGLLGNDKYPLAAANLFEYSLAMSFFAISFLAMNYLLSLNQTTVAYPLLAAMILQLVLIVLFHSDLSQVVHMMLISGIVSVVLLLPFFIIASRQSTGSS